jgi:hypothetical protein
MAKSSPKTPTLAESRFQPSLDPVCLPPRYFYLQDLANKSPQDTDEGIIYTLKWAVEWAKAGGQPPTAALYKDFLRKNFGNAATLVGKTYLPSLFRSKAETFVAEAGSMISEIGYNTTSLSILLAMTTVITDSTYRCPAWYGAAQATRNNIPAWAYEFSHSPTCPWLYTLTSDEVEYFGGAHTAELPFVFGNLDNSYLPNGTCNSTSAEWRLGGQMMDLWTAMAENAKPSTDDITWPHFQNQGTNLSTPGLNFVDSASPGVIDYNGCELWVEVNKILAASNATTSATPSASVSGSTSSPWSTQYNGAKTLLPNIGGYLALALLFIEFIAL